MAVQGVRTVTPSQRRGARYALGRNHGRLAAGEYVVTWGLRLARPTEDHRESTLPVELGRSVERPD